MLRNISEEKIKEEFITLFKKMKDKKTECIESIKKFDEPTIERLISYGKAELTVFESFNAKATSKDETLKNFSPHIKSYVASYTYSNTWEQCAKDLKEILNYIQTLLTPLENRLKDIKKNNIAQQYKNYTMLNLQVMRYQLERVIDLLINKSSKELKINTDTLGSLDEYEEDNKPNPLLDADNHTAEYAQSKIALEILESYETNTAHFREQVKAAQLEKKQIKEQSKALETQLKSQIQSLEEKLLLSEQLMYDAQRQVEELQQKIKTSTEHFKDSLDTLNLEKNLEKKAIQEQSEALENKLQSQIRPLTEKVLQSEKEMHDNQRQIEALEHQNTILTKQCADLATTLKKDNDIIFSTIDAKSLSSVLNCYATSGLFQKTISLTFTNLRNLTRGKLKKLTIHDIEKNIQGENQEKLLEIFRHPWIKNDILASHHMTKTANALRDIAYLFRNPSLSASPSTKSR